MKDKQTGKFENGKQLYDAYCALESEFTKRCQKMAEMEKELEELKKNKTPSLGEMLADTEFINDYILTNESIVSAVVGAYLKTLKNKNKISVLGTDGAVALFVSKKPSSLKEAKKLADVIIQQG
jgi:hypothetical protein